MAREPSVIIADDHPLARESLRQLVEKILPGARVTEAANADELRRLLDAGNGTIDLLLLDLVMPGAGRFELLEYACDTFPDLKVLVLSASESPYHKRKALDIGASGYVTKTEPRSTIGDAIRMVAGGGIYVPREFRAPDTHPSRDGETPDAADPLQVSVTPRQQEVLALVAQGKSNKAIARDLDLTENTVKIHVAAVLKALGVRNRTEAVMAARRLGLLEE
jgi:DNA-binding NarL/FixJ family response regulator